MRPPACFGGEQSTAPLGNVPAIVLSPPPPALEVEAMLLRNGASPMRLDSSLTSSSSGGLSYTLSDASDTSDEAASPSSSSQQQQQQQQQRATNPLRILCRAAEHGNARACKMILSEVRNVNAPYASGRGGPPRSALYHAAAGNHLSVLKVLLKHERTDVGGPDGSPLCIAAQNGHVKACAMLLDAGADPTACAEDGNPPLWVAAFKGRLDVCALLLTRGAHADQPNRNGSTALYAGAQEGHAPVVRMLLSGGASPLAKTKKGSFALYVAAALGRTDAVRALLELSAEGTPVDVLCNDSTALCAAADNGHVEVCEALLAGGADVHYTNRSGWTALALAERSGYPAVAALLRSRARADKLRVMEIDSTKSLPLSMSKTVNDTWTLSPYDNEEGDDDARSQATQEPMPMKPRKRSVIFKMQTAMSKTRRLASACLVASHRNDDVDYAQSTY